MKNKILELIEEYDNIVIARHKNPDFDAYGSQFGLYHALLEYFPKKKILIIGDSNQMNQFGELHEVDENTANKSLLIILDTVAKQMLDESVYEHYDKLILIDHHRNEPDIPYDLWYQDVQASSTSEIIAEMLLDWGIPINASSAQALYMGIVGDTGRFLYNNTTEKTYYIVSKLMAQGLDIQELHNSMYLEPKKNKIIKNIFFNKVQYTEKGLAYNKNDREFIEEHDLNTNYVSRGLVNQMSGILEVPIWVNFTEDLETGQIICEIRSRDIPVLDIAKKYGGGGHLNACGCTLKIWEETDSVIKDLNDLI